MNYLNMFREMDWYKGMSKEKTGRVKCLRIMNRNHHRVWDQYWQLGHRESWSQVNSTVRRPAPPPTLRPLGSGVETVGRKAMELHTFLQPDMGFSLNLILKMPCTKRLHFANFDRLYKQSHHESVACPVCPLGKR